ncbi:MAG: DNA primase, partial [Clostridiales bacterium]|nr:DNA primase [Candidatus Apopatousia equi]
MQDKGYSNDWLSKLKSSCNIVSVVSRYVPLQKKGRTYWGCCPFHHEKTPSFAVNDVEQYYHCFGCGESGDVITFVEKLEGVDFMQAVKNLAESVNLEVPQFTGDESIIQKKKERDLLVNICTEAARYYYSKLASSEGKIAKDYLTKRGVGDDTVFKMGLGYSPNWQGLIGELKKKGYTEEQMIKAGLVGQKDGRVFDAMAERLVFPIFNHVGKIVGFSGRALNDGAYAKYKNTEGTDIFNKSYLLYGINNLRKARVENQNYAILVEGQMDVVTLNQAGFNNAIATLGTAFNEHHVETISKFVDSIYICFDGDGAGKKAAEKSVELLKNTTFDVKVVSLSEKLDPDEYIKKYGKEAFENELKNAQTVREFQINALSEKFDLKDKSQITKFLNSALELIASFKLVTERDLYLKQVAKLSNMNEEILRRELNKKVRVVSSENNIKKVSTASVNVKENKLMQAEIFVLACRLYKKEFAENIKSDLFENNFFKEFNQYIIDSSPKVSDVIDNYDIENNEDLNKVVNFDFSSIKDELKQYKGCLNQLELRKLIKYQTELQIKLQTAKDNDRTFILNELQNTIRQIQNRKVEE